MNATFLNGTVFNNTFINNTIYNATTLAPTGSQPQVSYTVGWIGVITAIIFYGSSAAPVKLRSVQESKVDPMVYQLYYSTAIFLANWLLLIYNPWTFSYHGILGACCWVPASVCSIYAIKYIGIGIASGLWSGCIIIVSFLWGVIAFHDAVRNVPLTLLGLALLIAGIMGLATCKNKTTTTANPEKSVNKNEFARELPLDDIMEIAPQSPTSRYVQNGAVMETPAGTVGSPTVPVDMDDIMSRAQVRNKALPDDLSNPSHPDLHDDVVHIDVSTVPKTVTQRMFTIIRKSREKVIGGICVAGTGFLGGTQMVPARFDTESGVLFALSFGVGCMIVTPIMFVIYFLIKRERPQMHVKKALVPGLLSGLSFSIGNVGSTYAVLSPLGLTIGYPLCQVALVVMGIYGIFVFRELTGVRPISQFFASAILLLLPGCALLAIFGKA
ncbi:10 TM domain-containing transmembrane protein [Acrasis kona]|uniref:10 TM domain-containing transmembrane protein n=1 Tax=Acrasis kona TaxID=1008807 RepID=A0AAW2ZFW2_9EUKA